MTIRKLNQFFFTFFTLSVILTACGMPSETIKQQEALEIAWEMLDPNTESHNRDDWEIHQALKIYGKDVVNEFSNGRSSGCPGPALPENLPIKISAEYWYILVVPHPEVYRRTSEGAEPVPVVPEPRIVQASFLIDQYDGKVVARRITCK